jgi:hypothetical protein
MLAGAALLAAACGGSGERKADPSGSTLRSTYVDPNGTGVLVIGAGEPLLERTELGPASRPGAVLGTLAHVTDAHILDAQSPARVTFLDRLGPPFQSTFRPQETLTSQVLAGTLQAIRALRPDAVIQGGDLIDNDQANELALALAVLAGGHARSGNSVRPGYFGVQSALDADPFYYRPDLDAPRHPGLLEEATSSFKSLGVGASWCPVLGDHDILIAGEIVPNPMTRAIALGDQAVWDLPTGLTIPAGLLSGQVDLSPDGPATPEVISHLMALALGAPKVQVPTDPTRLQLDPSEVLRRLCAGARREVPGDLLDYRVDIGDHVRVLVLDLARRAGGSGGLVHPGQAQWLADELAAAGERWVLVFSHQEIAPSEGSDELVALLDSHPRVVAAIAGHVHRNRIVARETAAGGYWLITTASLVDYPQQARALRLLATVDGGIAIQTWMLDHVFPAKLGTISRQLAYLDAQGGRPEWFSGSPKDRNVTLYRAAPAA